MFKIDDDNSIHITRGDTANIEVSARTSTGDYTFAVGDVVRLQVMKQKDCLDIEFSKTVTVSTAGTAVSMLITSNDTRNITPVINRPQNFWYEIELNPETNPQTIIGYDDDGPKLFVVYPEGGDTDD